MLKSELRTENTHMHCAPSGAAWYVAKSHSNAASLKYTTGWCPKYSRWRWFSYICYSPHSARLHHNRNGKIARNPINSMALSARRVNTECQPNQIEMNSMQIFICMLQIANALYQPRLRRVFTLLEHMFALMLSIDR